MNVKNKEKSLEEKLEDSYKESLATMESQDFVEDLKTDMDHYLKAPGSYVPNVNEQRHITEDYNDDFQEDYEVKEKYTHPNEIKHFSEEPYKSFHNYKLYMGEKTQNIYSEDFIEDSLRVSIEPEKTKLVDSELKNELKELANILKICERYIAKRGARIIVGFRDGVEMLRHQFEEGMSHLHQATYKTDTVVGDFIQDNALRTWHMKQFKDKVKPLLRATFDFLKEFEAGRKILDII